MEITIQLYHVDEKNSTSIPMTITLGMYLNEFFDRAEKIFPQPCLSAVGKKKNLFKKNSFKVRRRNYCLKPL
jgi:hypothetical protein